MRNPIKEYKTNTTYFRKRSRLPNYREKRTYNQKNNNDYYK